MNKRRTVENESNFRNAVRSHDNWTCQNCGSVEYPQAHHLEPGNNAPSVGITLCVYCHADKHPDVYRGLFIAKIIRAEREGCISAGALAKELSVNPVTIVRRARKLGILKPLQEWMFTLQEADLLRAQKFRTEHLGGKQITVKLGDGQKDWLYKEADRQMANSSAVVRQAIKLLMEKTEREKEK